MWKVKCKTLYPIEKTSEPKTKRRLFASAIIQDDANGEDGDKCKTREEEKRMSEQQTVSGVEQKKKSEGTISLVL